MPRTIEDVRQLGYDVSVAYGAVEPELEALAAARAAAEPEAVHSDAEPVIARSVELFLSLAQQYPDDPRYSGDQAADFIARISEQSIRMLARQRDAQVELYERSVEIAKSMPTVWVISGPGIERLYVSCSSDGSGADAAAQDVIEALCDAEGHAERCFQHHAPADVVDAVLRLRDAGEKVEASADERGFEVAFAGRKHRAAKTLAEAVEKALPPGES